VRVHEFDGRHRAEQEEDDLGDLAEIVDEWHLGEPVNEVRVGVRRRQRLPDGEVRRRLRERAGTADGEARPEHRAEQQRGRGFVNPNRVLQRNACVTEHEEDNHCSKHGVVSKDVK